MQRRPAGGKPPYQSPALRRYVRDLQDYIESHGGRFHDDTGDTAITLDMYEDGDHIGRDFRRLLHRHPVRTAAPAPPVIFHSLDFVVFFLAVTTLYWRLPQRGQNVLLLAASYVFYGYVHPWFLILIGTSTVIDYCAARGMEAWPAHRLRFMWLSIVSNFGMLGFFKYFNFFAENVAGVLGGGGAVRVAADAAHHAAGRDFVLHVPGDELHD